MEWAVIVERILSGSPWALLLGVCWYHWRTRAQHLSVIKEKEGVVKAKDEQIQALNVEYKEAVTEMASHVEEIHKEARKEAVDLQERRVKETGKMQKQFVDAMSGLQTTLNALTERLREEQA
jgi:hypothetical protein